MNHSFGMRIPNVTPNRVALLRVVDLTQHLESCQRPAVSSPAVNVINGAGGLEYVEFGTQMEYVIYYPYRLDSGCKISVCAQLRIKYELAV